MAKKSIMKNYIYNLSYQILTLILPIVTTPYLARVLGATGIGIYGYTFSICTYFNLFGSLGVALYGQREIAYNQDNKSKRNKIFYEIIVLRFITMTISILIYAFCFMRKGDYVLYYRILVLELIATAFDISWFFQGLEEFKKTVIRNILVRVVAVSLVFVFVKEKTDLNKFVLIYSLADLIGNLSLWIYLPKYLRGEKVGKIYAFQHLLPILMLFVPQISNQLYKMLDTTMIGKLITDKAETGYYEQAQKIVRLLITIVTSLGTIMIPRIAHTFEKGNSKKIVAYIEDSFCFTFLLSFPMMIGISCVANSFVPFFLGSGYDKVIVLIRVICPILLLLGIANVVGTQYLLPTKRQKEYTNSIIVGVVINFILNYFLILKFESIGASIATVVSQLAIDVIQLYIVRNEISLKKVLYSSIKYLISSIVMGVLCMMIFFLMKASVKTMIIQVIIGAISYSITLILLKDRFVMEILNKFKVKFSTNNNS